MKVLINNEILEISEIVFYKDIVVKKYKIINNTIRKIAINEIKINEYLKYNKYKYAPKIIKVKVFSKYIEIYFKRISNKKLNRKPLIEKRLSNIIKSLHRINVCHNDINLSNILTDGKNIYLIDFALSTITDNFNSDNIRLSKIESWIYNGSLF